MIQESRRTELESLPLDDDALGVMQNLPGSRLESCQASVKTMLSTRCIFAITYILEKTKEGVHYFQPGQVDVRELQHKREAADPLQPHVGIN